MQHQGGATTTLMLNRSLDSDTLPLSFDRPDLDFVGDEEGSGFDPADEFVQPLQEDNWYKDLGDASGLETSQIMAFFPPWAL